MKNCIVFSGHYRTFDKTKENLKHFINANEMDVFCHLWVTNESEIDSIKKELNPKKLSFGYTKDYEKSFDELHQRVNQVNPKSGNIDNLSTQASNHFSRFQAYDLIDKNSEYENLVYCRYDLAFRDLFKFDKVQSVITPLEEAYNIISDIFSIMPFRFSSPYFLYNNYEKLHSTPFEEDFIDYLRNVHKYPENDIQTHINDRYCPHMLLLRNFFLNNIPHTTFNLPVYLQR